MEGERRAVISDLLSGSHEREPYHKGYVSGCVVLSVCKRTADIKWNRYKAHIDAGVVNPDIHNWWKGNSGRKSHDPKSLKDSPEEISMKNHTAMHTTLSTLRIPYLILCNFL
ncbi:unnamed protein product, partial [Discosporangium mesarthrocarpum]